MSFTAPAPITYRVDYATVDQPDVPVVAHDLSRTAAMRSAASLSAKPHIGTAYAIARQDGKDTGQRVYCNGYLSDTDGTF